MNRPNRSVVILEDDGHGNDLLMLLLSLGLEQNHPNLLIGLVVCQKPKRPEACLQEVGQKKPSLLIHSDSKDANNPTSLKTLEVDIGQQSTKTLSDPNVLIKTSMNLVPSCISSSRSCSSVLSQPEPITCDSSSTDSTGTTALQTILDTLFGQRKQNPDPTNCEMSSATDQQVQQICKEEPSPMDLSDDRPYDPEEYDPALTYGVLQSNSSTKVAEDDDRPYDPEEEYNAVDKEDFAKTDVSKATNTQESTTVNVDVAYDPEDETVFEEMQNYLAGNAITPQKFNICEQDNILNSTLSEQQKILEELNRQIEEQKRQLEEQTETLRLQKEAIGLSMAHFSVSHALMSPPPNFGRDEEEEIEKTPYFPTVNEFRDPRIWRTSLSRDAEDATEAPNNENATNVKENQTAVASKEKLENDKTLPSEALADTETVQLQNTTRSRSELCSETGVGRRSSRKRSHEHRSDRHERPSSRPSYKSRVSKDTSDRHHTSRHSSKHQTRGSDSERKRLTSRSHHDRHHHRDSSSSSRYKRRSDSSTRSHSSCRDGSSQDNSDRSHKTDQQQPLVDNAQSSKPVCEQPPVLQGSKADANESSQRPHTSQNPGEESLNNNRNHSEVNIKIDHPKQELLPMSCMQNIEILHGYTDQPLNSTTPTLQLPQTKVGVPNHDKVEPSNQLSHNQPNNFSVSNHTALKRGRPGPMQRQNSLQNKPDRLSGGGDYPQRASQLQYRDFTQTNNSQLNCGDIPPQELPQNKRKDFLAREVDRSSQLQMSCKQEGFTTGERGQCDKQMFPNHRDQKDSDWSEEHRPPLLRRCSVEEPEINQPHHKKGRSYMKGQDLHRVESSQFQQRESILGPPPVDLGLCRPRPLNPSCFDKVKPSTEPLSMMEQRKFGQPRNINTSTFAHSQTFRPGGQSPGLCTFQDDTDTHSGSHHTMEAMGPVDVRGPTEGPFHDPHQSHLKSPKGNAPYRQFPNEHNIRSRFHKGHSNNRDFSHQRPNKSRECPPPHDAYESQRPYFLQTFGDDAEACRTQTCLPKRSQPYPQDSTCEESPTLFEIQQYPEIEGQPRGRQQSGLRGQDGAKCFGRGHNVNAQMRGPRFDTLEQFMDQRAQSPDFHVERRPSSRNCDRFQTHDESQSLGIPNTTRHQFRPHVIRPEHLNPCESQNMRQTFESPLGQKNVRPLRLSGPLLPTPVGCRIRPNIPRLQRPHHESSRSQGPASMRHCPVTHDISGSWVHGEDHNFTHRSDTAESLVQEEQRVEFEGRRGQQSVQESNYGQPCRETRGRNSTRRAGQRRIFGNISHRDRDYSI